MKELPKTLESQMRVHYHDCDPFNHLNNSRYIDYIVAARTEQLLENYGFDTAQIARDQGLGWVVVQTQISYMFPAVWLEKVNIESRLIQFSDSSLLIEALMWNEHKTHLKALMWSKLVHFDVQSQKSIKHQDNHLELFRQIHFPLSESITFDERVKQVRQK